ncbi:polysaccharide biosynthesis tyrosine autokinase [Anaerostipes sp.]|uniref:polysaccharide biosynthesis tyrosine autokinase n=1 Tax=Anaerostipes sp. TaxID=1872530 RepID=UPI00258BC01B|nr:CpsD/CapB family tyrosine-protein kinase [Anaerostipes sp.]MCI5623935.1 CpsD/CapB family tyrosine-protein kinase [Anaerostipes sp.]
MNKEGKKQDSYFVNVLRKLFGNIIVMFLIALSITMGIFFLSRLKDSYRYTAGCDWTIKSQMNNNTLSDQKMAKKQLAELFTSNIMKEQLKKDLGEKSVFLEDCSISSFYNVDSNLVSLRVSAKKADTAYLVLERVIVSYYKIQEGTSDGFYLELVKMPEKDEIEINNNVDGSGVKYFATIFWIAVLCMVVLVFVFTAFDGKVRSEEDVEEKLSVPCLGCIGQEKSSRALLVTHRRVNQTFNENIRKICSSVKYMMNLKQTKVLMVTSTRNGEGKTLIASNLALLFAQKEKKVLLIEINPRRCILENTFKVKADQSDEYKKYMFGEITFDDMLVRCPAEDALSMVAFNDDYELDDMIKQGFLTKFMQEAKAKMDVIILDTSSCGNSDLPFMLAKYADSILYIVRQNKLSEDSISDCMEELIRNRGKILGCVLNGVQGDKKSLIKKSKVEKKNA